MIRPGSARGEVRVQRLSVSPGGPSTWQVVGHPFRVVALGAAWRLIALGTHARRLLDNHDLLERPFSSRAAAMKALSTVLVD
jgi:hypothetical protein